MKADDKNRPPDPHLRAAAETELVDQPSAGVAGRSAEELLHELRVHQIELEMQNETLRQEQNALKESRDLYADLYDFAPVGYLTLSADGMIVRINLTAARLLGADRQRLLQRRFVNSVSDEERGCWLRHVVNVNNRTGGSRIELALQREDGAPIQCALDCEPIPAGVDNGAIRVTLSDITERKEAEAERVSLEAQLRESQKMEAIGTLAGGIAHDFNNIIATILGNTELASEDTLGNSQAQESLDEIRKAAQRARDLVQQILSFSRRQPTEHKRITLAPVVAESVRLLRASLPARLELEVYCEPDAPPALADASQILQILVNLVTNAMQAMRSGPGRISIRLDTVRLDEALVQTQPALRGLHEKCPGSTLRLAVSDTGPGMDTLTLARVFEPFFTTKVVGEGTGLGLSVVHGIVQAHGGAITVVSQPGIGTIFTIYLSAVTTGADVMAAEGDAPVATSALSLDGGKRILYVDDDEALVFLVTRLLERRGFQVSGYTNQTEALAALRAGSAGFDLVVSDYNMPGMSGLDVAREVRSIRADLPVVIASGFVDEELRAQAAVAGVRKVIFKATAVEEFCEIVQRLAQGLPPTGRAAEHTSRGRQ